MSARDRIQAERAFGRVREQAWPPPRIGHEGIPRQACDTSVEPLSQRGVCWRCRRRNKRRIDPESDARCESRVLSSGRKGAERDEESRGSNRSVASKETHANYGRNMDAVSIRKNPASSCGSWDHVRQKLSDLRQSPRGIHEGSPAHDLKNQACCDLEALESPPCSLVLAITTAARQR